VYNLPENKEGAVDMKIDEALAELERLKADNASLVSTVDQLTEELSTSTDLHEADVRGKLIKWMRENTTISYESILQMDTATLKSYKDVAKHFKAPSFMSSGDGRPSRKKLPSTEEMLDEVYNKSIWG
jgi:archaellum component FlaC